MIQREERIGGQRLILGDCIKVMPLLGKVDAVVTDAPFGISDAPTIIPTWAHKHHKNQKPVTLMRRLIEWTGAQTILDPFMGSGTTLVACQRLGRNGIGIELDPDYFDIACRRVEEATRQPDMFITPPPPPPQQKEIDL